MTRPDRPQYAEFMDMRGLSTAHAALFASQIIATCAPDLPVATTALDVLDVGSGYGPAAQVMAGWCRSVVGLEPMREPYEHAVELAAGIPNLTFRHQSVSDMDEAGAYDLIVLDNVYEHLADQADALARINRALRPGGVVYLLLPNRLWPREVHYGLPFLSWLPLTWANRYLRWSGRGEDYTDASYAPTVWGLRKALARHENWTWRFTLPALPEANHLGTPWHYRLGMRILAHAPPLWAVSKSFLVVVRKDAG